MGKTMTNNIARITDRSQTNRSTKKTDMISSKALTSMCSIDKDPCPHHGETDFQKKLEWSEGYIYDQWRGRMEEMELASFCGTLVVLQGVKTTI